MKIKWCYKIVLMMTALLSGTAAVAMQSSENPWGDGGAINSTQYKVVHLNLDSKEELTVPLSCFDPTSSRSLFLPITNPFYNDRTPCVASVTNFLSCIPCQAVALDDWFVTLLQPVLEKIAATGVAKTGSRGMGCFGQK